MRKKNNQSLARTTVCVECLHFLHVSAWVFFEDPVSSRIPEMCIRGELVCRKCPGLSECGCVSVPFSGKVSCPGWVLPGAQSYQD